MTKRFLKITDDIVEAAIKAASFGRTKPAAKAEKAKPAAKAKPAPKAKAKKKGGKK